MPGIRCEKTEGGDDESIAGGRERTHTFLTFTGEM